MSDLRYDENTKYLCIKKLMAVTTAATTNSLVTALAMA
jgi:hypothetical protein